MEFFDGLKGKLSLLILRGITTTINSQTILVKERDNSGNVTKCSGAAVPTDAGAGYAIGCEFTLTTGNGIGTTKYFNEGSASSCDFNVMATPEVGDISSVTADSGLVGGGSSGAVTLSRGLAVRNETGSTITKGSLVRVSGYSSGNSLPLVVLADADASAGAAMYVATADITNNANGTVYGVAIVTNINTDAAAAVGDPLYLSTTAGAFTQTAPTAADSMVQRVAIVTVKHATTGAALFFPELRVMDKIGRNELQDSIITPGKESQSANLTATADGTGSGSANVDSKHFNVTSAAATDQCSLPGSSNSNIGKVITMYVGANGFELITPAGSNATINGTDADGTNQLDVPANSLVRCTLVANNQWLAEVIGSTGTVSAPIIPDND